MASNSARTTDHSPNPRRTLTQNPPRHVSTSTISNLHIPASLTTPTQPPFPAAAATTSTTASTQQWQAFATGGAQQNDQLRAENTTLHNTVVSLNSQLRTSQHNITTLQTQINNLQTQITAQARIINSQPDAVRQSKDSQQDETVQRNAILRERIEEREERVRLSDKQVWQLTGKGQPWEGQECALCGRSGEMGRLKSERQEEGGERGEMNQGKEDGEDEVYDGKSDEVYDEKSDEVIGGVW